MAYDYRGDEIVSELVINSGGKGSGKIKQRQKVDVKCSQCGNIKNVDYQAHAKNRLNSPDKSYRCIRCGNSHRMFLYNKEQKGKSLEERLGVESATELKNKLSKISKDTNRVRHLTKFYGMTWEEKFGKEKSDLMKSHHRDICRFEPKYGENNPQFGKPAHRLSGSGVKGYYDGVFFRSLLEASFIHKLKLSNTIFESGEIKKYAIPYIHEDVSRNYFCDFIINGDYYEIKPESLMNTIQNRTKFEAAKLYCKDLGVEFFVKSEKDFHQLSDFELESLIKGDIVTII